MSQRVRKLLLIICLMGGCAVVYHRPLSALLSSRRPVPAESEAVGQEDAESLYFSSNLPIVVIDTLEEIRVACHNSIPANSPISTPTNRGLGEPLLSLSEQ
jgi:hypothetical protein